MQSGGPALRSAGAEPGFKWRGGAGFSLLAPTLLSALREPTGDPEDRKGDRSVAFCRQECRRQAAAGILDDEGHRLA